MLCSLLHATAQRSDPTVADQARPDARQGASPGVPALRHAWLYLLFLPAVLLLVPFMVVPLLAMVGASFGHGTMFLGGDTGISLRNYQLIVGDPFYLMAFVRTVGLGAGIVAVSIALGMPLAYWMLRHPKWRTPILIALIGPLLINVVARLYGWQLLLADSGPLNRLLMFLLPIGDPILFMGSFKGVTIVMVHIMLPYMTMALFNSLQTIESSIIDAAATLGATSWSIFWRVAVPLAVPGLITGSIVVFSLSASAFAAPAVIGGGKVNLVPTLVYQESLTMNFSRAAALTMLLLIVLLPLARLSAMLDRSRG